MGKIRSLICCQLVEIQQIKEPPVTNNTPCQNSTGKLVCKMVIEISVEKMGLKYDKATKMAILP